MSTHTETALEAFEEDWQEWHAAHGLLQDYQGTPAYTPNAAFAVAGTFVPFEAPRRARSPWFPQPMAACSSISTAPSTCRAPTQILPCPLPPAENRLPVAIEAGEKIPYERQDQK
jgi:uncharacterized protein (DUF1684 family)